MSVLSCLLWKMPCGCLYWHIDTPFSDTGGSSWMLDGADWFYAEVCGICGWSWMPSWRVKFPCSWAMCFSTTEKSRSCSSYSLRILRMCFGDTLAAQIIARHDSSTRLNSGQFPSHPPLPQTAPCPQTGPWRGTSGTSGTSGASGTSGTSSSNMALLRPVQPLCLLPASVPPEAAHGEGKSNKRVTRVSNLDAPFRTCFLNFHVLCCSTAPCTTAGQVEGRSPLAFKAYLMHISRSFIGLWLSEELQDSSGPLKINLTSKSANSCPRSVNGLASAIILRAS